MIDYKGKQEKFAGNAGNGAGVWNYTWNDSGRTLEAYRVRIICNFNPNRTQLILKAEAEYLEGGNWIQGFDTRAIETLRTDLTNVVGN